MANNFKPPRQNQKGLTLVEIVVAGLVLSLIAVGVAFLYSNGHKASVSARDQIVAKSVTEMIVNRYQTLNFNDVLGADSSIKQGSLAFLGKTTTTFVNDAGLGYSQFATNPHSTRYFDNYYVNWSTYPAQGFLEDIEKRVLEAGFTRFRVIVRFSRADSSDTSGNNSTSDVTSFNDGNDADACDDRDPNLCFNSNWNEFIGTHMETGKTVANVPNTDFRVLSIELYKKNQLIVSRVGVIVSRVKLTGNQAASSESPLRCDVYYPQYTNTYYHLGDDLGGILDTRPDLTNSLALGITKKRVKSFETRTDAIAIQGGGTFLLKTPGNISKFGVNYITAVSEVGAFVNISTGQTLPPFFSRLVSGTPSSAGYNFKQPIGAPGVYSVPPLIDDAAYDGRGAVSFFLADNPSNNIGVLKELGREKRRYFYARASHNGVYSPWSIVTANTDITIPKIDTNTFSNPDVLPVHYTVAPPTITSLFPYVRAVIRDSATYDSSILNTDQFPSGIDVNTVVIATKESSGSWSDQRVQMITTLAGQWPSGNRPLQMNVVLIDTMTLLPYKFEDTKTYDLRVQFADYVTYGAEFPGLPYSPAYHWGFKIQLPGVDLSSPTITNMSPADGATVGSDYITVAFDLADPESGVDPESLDILVTDTLGTVKEHVLQDALHPTGDPQPGRYYTFDSKLTPVAFDPTTGGFHVALPVTLRGTGTYTITVNVKNCKGTPNVPPSWTITRP